MWQVEILRGDAGTFHRRDLPEPVAPVVWWFDVASPALVLGSSQPMDHVDIEACARLGVDVIRRRSGGGAVLLRPGEALWADIVVPTSHPRWTDDVGRSAWWVGEAWASALDAVGVGGTSVHRGPMVRTQWSGHVCFAGVGGGEVLRAGRKVVGISQRRTRHAARFQCALYRRWDAPAHAELFRVPGPTADDLADLAEGVPGPVEALRNALTAALT